MAKVRIDKWLWSVRIFKTRTISTNACKSNKVQIEGEVVKASNPVAIGDIVSVKKQGYTFQYRVIKLIEKRVSASLAAECYDDITPEEEMMKYESWFIGKSSAEKREKGAGRPTKRERRELQGYKNQQFDEDQ